MAAQISFWGGGYGFSINNLGGSGIGGFGVGGFGQSVPVGSQQSTSYITNSDGTVQGPQINNVAYITAQSGQVAGSTTLNLLSIPNYQSTLNIRLNNTTPVRCQNSKFYVYDRVSLSNPASGVTTAVSHVIHPGLGQVQTGSGSINWEFPAGSSYLNMGVFNNGVGFSPGISGLSPNGAGTTDVQHDWYLNMSMSPNSIGSKSQYGCFFQTDYL